MRPLVVALLVAACSAASVGATLLLTRRAEPAAPAPAESPACPQLARTVDTQQRAIASLRTELETCRRAKRASAPAPSATADDGATMARAVKEAVDEELQRKAEEAANDEAARTAAWSNRMVSDLGLSDAQRAKIDAIARWAEDQRAALADRADRDSLDAAAVRAAIGQQRDEYDARMKELLTPAQFEQFDAIQGIDRRPPTFARVPWIMGDRTATR
ncbi:MAG TPA: hypothetical protein VHB21_04770 [Minicystis sp.]|nr:hypothetical protein [Minicystis sp.]